MPVAVVSFYRYAAIAKNLRRVIYSSLSFEEFSKHLSWLLRRFRYRNVGVPPLLKARYGSAIPRRKILLELSYPIARLRRAVEGLAGLGLDECAAEAYALASAYVSSVMVLGRESLKKLKPLVSAVVRVREYPDEKSWRLHAGIADYTVLDFYGWATESGLKVVKALAEGRALSQLLEERCERVDRFKNRFCLKYLGRQHSRVIKSKHCYISWGQAKWG